MAVKLTAIFIDYDGTEINFSSVVDPQRIKLNTANGVKKTTDSLGLMIDIRDWHNGLYPLKKRMEVWVGWRDQDTQEWQVNDLWGGYVRSFKINRHSLMLDIDVSLDSYDILFSTTVVPSYPDVNAAYAYSWHIHDDVIPDPGTGFIDRAINGYVHGATSTDWLVGETAIGTAPEHPHGGKFYNGLIPTFLGGHRIDLNGVDDSRFGTFLFDETYRPSNTVIPGHLEHLWLYEAIELVLSYATIVHRATHGADVDYVPLRPIYYMKPVPDYTDATQVIPRFMAVDFNILTDTDFTFSDDPSDEYLHQWWGFNAEDDATGLFTAVYVKGEGAYKVPLSEDPDSDPADPFWRRVFSTDFSFRYDSSNPDTTGPPTKYQSAEGWQTIIIDSKIDSRWSADQLAHIVAETVWQGKQRYTFYCYQPVQVGDIVKIIHRATMGMGTLGKNFPVVDVDKTVESGRSVYHVTVGWEHPTLQDVLGGSAKRLIELQAVGITPAKAGSMFNFNNPKVPLSVGLSQNPTQAFRNAVAAATDNVPGMRLKSAINRGFSNEYGQPIGNNSYNRYSEPITIATPERPVPGTSLIPPPLFPVYDEKGKLVQWFDAGGKDHPQHHTFSFVSDDFEPLVFPTDVIISTVEISALYNEDGLQIYPRKTTSGTITSTVTLPTVKIWKYDRSSTLTTPAMILVAPDVNQDNPLYVNSTDELYTLNVTSLTDGYKVSVLVSEANPHPKLFEAASLP